MRSTLTFQDTIFPAFSLCKHSNVLSLCQAGKNNACFLDVLKAVVVSQNKKTRKEHWH